MKKVFYAALFTVILAVIFSDYGDSADKFKHIDKDEAMKIVATEKNIVILDVRTQEEYDRKHIKNAVLLPIEEIRKGNFSEKLPDKNQKILVYCRTGRRSEDSAKILSENGYRNICDIGGLKDWEGEVEGSEVFEENLERS